MIVTNGQLNLYQQATMLYLMQWHGFVLLGFKKWRCLHVANMVAVCQMVWMPTGTTQLRPQFIDRDSLLPSNEHHRSIRRCYTPPLSRKVFYRWQHLAAVFSDQRTRRTMHSHSTYEKRGRCLGAHAFILDLSFFMYVRRLHFRHSKV